MMDYLPSSYEPSSSEPRRRERVSRYLLLVKNPLSILATVSIWRLLLPPTIVASGNCLPEILCSIAVSSRNPYI